MITAAQARLNFCDDDYVQALITVNEAILDTASGMHRVTVNIPTGAKPNDKPIAWYVFSKLMDNGFNIKMIHDPENGSSELTIDWSEVIEGYNGSETPIVGVYEHPKD